jgi:hypothetical protein
MPGFATLWLTWEPRMLSILRIMVGLLYMEHGLAKILDADSDEVARRFRDDVARRYEMMSPGWRAPCWQ